MANLEIHKKIRKSVKKIGVQRFITGVIFLFAGLVWKVFQTSGDANSGLTFQRILSFWPIFWALWMGSGFLWWILSGFKSVNGLIFSFAGGAFMAETVLPGVIMNAENGPYFIILVGLFIFALPRKNYQTTPYSYSHGRSKGESFQSGNHSSQRKIHLTSLAEQNKNNQSSSDSI